MKLSTGTISRCSGGGNHVDIPITIGGNTYTLSVTRNDLKADFESKEDAKDAIIARLRSAAKEQADLLGKTLDQLTLLEWRTALQNKTFVI